MGVPNDHAFGASPPPSRERHGAQDAAHGGRSRLIITEMVLENFKSYAGVQRVGPFHKCFSSVVGPNGSGKSNVIDAMLFVFGKRAKQLRLNKVSELIHNSTDHQNLESARVSVHFKEIIDLDDEKYESVPGSEFIISRTAYRNNTSKYHVDDCTSTFTEVTRLLKDKGIDLDNNRFLILQGEVEQIAMMKPKAQGPHDEGLLEYLEDIIGSNKYIEKIDEGSQQLEALNEQRVGLVERVKHAEKEKNTLEGAKRAAEAFMLKEAQCSQWSMVARRLALGDTRGKQSTLAGRVAELEGALGAEKNKCSGLREELQQKTDACDACNKEYEAVCGELETARADFKEYERKDVMMKEGVKHCKAKLKKLTDKIAKDTAKVGELEKAAVEAEAAVPRLEQEAATLAPRLVEAEAKLEAIQERVKVEVEKQQQQVGPLQEQLAPWEAKASEAKAKADVTRTQLSLIRDKHEAAGKQLVAVQQAIEEKEEGGRQKQAQLARMEAAVRENEEVAATSATEEQAKAEEEVAVRAEAEAAQGKAAELKEAAASQRSSSAILSALMQAKRDGSIPGIFGRLGDLGAIDAKYDIAISTACGQLEYVVVDNIETAQACTELLRERQLGVQTFLALDKQQHLQREMAQQVSTPEGVPRLFDLIQVQDPRLLPAFFFALRNTVVATNLDQGNRISYGTDQRFRRVVTLDGEMFESSGTMAGGGRPKGGRMGSSLSAAAAAAGGGVSRGMVEEAEREVERVLGRLEGVREEKRAAAGRREKAVEALRRLKMEIPKVQMEVESLVAQVAELRQRVPGLQAASVAGEEEQQRMGELQSQVEREEGEVARIQEGMAPLVAQLARLMRLIEAAGKEELEEQRAHVAAVQKAIDDAQRGIHQSQAAIAASSRNGEKLRAALAEAEAERGRVEEEMGQKREEMNRVMQEAFVVNENYEQLREKVENKKEEFAGIKKAFSAVKAQLDAMRQGEVEVELKLEDSRKALKLAEDSGRLQRQKLRSLGSQLMGQLKQIQAEGIAEEDVEAAGLPWDLREEGEGMEGEGMEGGEVGRQRVEGRKRRARARAAAADEESEDMDEDDVAEEGEGEEGGEGEPGEGEGAAEGRDEKLERLVARLCGNMVNAVTSREEAVAGEQRLRTELETLKGNLNLSSIAEYRKREAVYTERLGELEGVTVERDALRQAHEELKRQRLEEFMTGFDIITMRLKEMYQMITLGGDAELELVDSLDPFSEGIVFSVRPPKKSWKNICNLSGGEKTLSSLALVFALHHYKPTPLYVMDEIDAALDFKNVSIVAHYIKERTKDAQFVIISLRNNMFELADHLVGIYKTHNCTKSITINPRSFIVSAAPAAAAPTAS